MNTYYMMGLRKIFFKKLILYEITNQQKNNDKNK